MKEPRRSWGLVHVVFVLVGTIRCGSRDGPPIIDASTSGAATSSENGDTSSGEGGASSSPTGHLGGDGGQGRESGDDSSDWEDGACPTFAAPKARSRPTGTLLEASGLVQSRLDPARLWAHNDSGDTPRLFALDSEGNLEAILQLDTAFPTDWEDLAAYENDAGEAHLLIADTGDNTTSRDSVSFVILPEPLILDESTTYSTRTRSLAWTDGPVNVEAVFVDEQDQRVYLLSKTLSPRLYSFSLVEADDTLRFDGTLRGAWPSGIVPNGADFRFDQPFIAVRGETQAGLFLRRSGLSVFESLDTVPCLIDLANEVQGEAIAIDASGGLLTLDESTNPLQLYDRK